jgi:transcriptional regulator with GAF, ATPase, and Fis domain
MSTDAARSNFIQIDNMRRNKPLLAVVDSLPTPYNLESTIERFLDLARSMVAEGESLMLDDAFVKTLSRSGSVATEINFYDEVARFEISLIKLALERTKGNQARASRLLRLKPTTLHAKIKQYGIPPSSEARRISDEASPMVTSTPA